ncbi:hypothetical protein DESC_610268 [Desulfosarcina cetonica]|nr:hypothetical protein DESC_610268 [Desulfosarcina cetonica]
MLLQPLVQPGRRTGHDRKESELVDNAAVNGRRFEKKHQVLAQGIEPLNLTQGVLEHLQGKGVGALADQLFVQGGGQEFVDLHVIGKPDDPVAIEAIRVRRGEVGGHKRRVGPVQKARGQAMVLGDGNPAPGGGIVSGPGYFGVFAEIAQEVILQVRMGAATPAEAVFQIVAAVRQSAIGVIGAETPQHILPGIVVQAIAQLAPTAHPDIVTVFFDLDHFSPSVFGVAPWGLAIMEGWASTASRPNGPAWGQGLKPGMRPAPGRPSDRRRPFGCGK